MLPRGTIVVRWVSMGKLVASPLHQRVLAELEPLTNEMVNAVLMALPEYRGDLSASLKENLRNVLLALAQPGTWDSKLAIPQIVEVVRTRASSKVPLESGLQAWRISGNALWAWLETTALEMGTPSMAMELWSRYIELTNVHLESVSQIYNQTRTRLDLATGAAFGELLLGQEPDATARKLQTLGLASQTISIVACAAPDNGQDPMAALEQFSPFLQALAQGESYPPIVVRGKTLVSIIDGAPMAANRLRQRMEQSNISLHLGLSRPAPTASNLTTALTQAEEALACATPDRPFVCASEMTLAEMVAVRADVDWEELPGWLQDFIKEDTRLQGQLTQTVDALMACRWNVSEAAALLNLHPNSVYYRLNSIKERFSVDLRSPDQLFAIHMANNLADLGRLRNMPVFKT